VRAPGQHRYWGRISIFGTAAQHPTATTAPLQQPALGSPGLDMHWITGLLRRRSFSALLLYSMATDDFVAVD